MLGKTERFIFLYNYTDYGAGLYSSGSILFSRCGVFDGYEKSDLNRKSPPIRVKSEQLYFADGTIALALTLETKRKR